MTTNEYKLRFPNHPLISEETSKTKSINMKGKNVGNPRPDAKERMTEDNPMWNTETSNKMGKTRSARISKGEIDALRNLGHLPTDKEKIVQQILIKYKFPLNYVGDGQVWIGNRCPDFINEELHIVVELDLDVFAHEQERVNSELFYMKHGYKLIWLVSIKEEEIKNWLTPFFFGLKWTKIDSITKEKTTRRKEVCNIACHPNNNYFAEGVLVHNCFADSFRSSLYTSFFDNSRSMGMRHCKPEYFRAEMDKLMKYRGKKIDGPELNKAISLQIPIRLGIRFEDFLPIEARDGVSLNFMQYLQEQNYPIMVNTKSGLIGREDYVKALADNKAGAAVHMTMISSDDTLNKKIEPGAPSFLKRIEASKALVDAGVRVVARIEPLMIFINDTPEDVERWVEAVWGAGIRHITFDTYSFSASAPGVQRQMERAGFDFERMFRLMSDSQWLGSLILNEFMKMLYTMKPFSMSTFDFGSAPNNSDDICCEVSDLYLSKGGNFSWGNNIMAIRFIQKNTPNPVTWGEYNK
jgi:very-short-patch-repair endonuclease